jgi:hypothetical protein
MGSILSHIFFLDTTVMISEVRKQEIKNIVKSLVNKSMKEILDDNNIKLYYRSLQDISDKNNIS